MQELVNISGIVVHHTAAPADMGMSYLRAYHVEKRGYEDIGYHYVVLRACGRWHIVEGRSTEYEGAHCREHGRNHDTLGVAIGGCYEPYRGAAPDRLDTESIGALAELLAMLVTRHSLGLDNNIAPHCQYSDTLCPGIAVRESWPGIIDAVAMRLPLEGARV